MQARGWTALGLMVGCYQPEFVKDSAASGTDTGASVPDTDTDDLDLPETTTACITAFPVSGSGDLASDAPVVGDVDTRVEDVLADCELAGVTCEVGAWLSHDAATCIGPHVGVDAGIDGTVYAALRFDAPLGMVVWVVENDLGTREGSTERVGDGVWLDATSGAVVSGPYEWRSSTR